VEGYLVLMKPEIYIHLLIWNIKVITEDLSMKSKIINFVIDGV